VLTDIDVVEPDEKSIVTYVSLLYDIFPNVPSLEQSLRDNVSFISVFCRLYAFVWLISCAVLYSIIYINNFVNSFLR